MKKVTIKEYEFLIKNKKMLSISRDNAKVLENEGNIIKIFPTRHKKYLHSDAYKFSRNVADLQKINISTVKILEEYHVVPENIFYIEYAPLEGISLEKHMEQFPRDREIIYKFSKYLAHLHNLGVYFRAAQFKNIIVRPNREFGLIDIASVTVKKKPLNIWRRARHLKVYARKRYKKDLYFILKYHFGYFIEEYMQASHIQGIRRTLFLKMLLFYSPEYIPFITRK